MDDDRSDSETHLGRGFVIDKQVATGLLSELQRMSAVGEFCVAEQSIEREVWASRNGFTTFMACSAFYVINHDAHGFGAS